MWGNGRWDGGDVIAAVMTTVLLGTVFFAVYRGNQDHDKRCRWEQEHSVVSYECRNWKAE